MSLRWLLTGVQWGFLSYFIVLNTIYPETDIDQARAAAERLAEERG